MADTINVPGLGKTKRTTAYLLGGGALLVLGIAWYRARNAPAGDSLTGAAAGGAENAIDPATGFPYGSDQDLAALGQMTAVGGGPGQAYYGGDGANVSGGSQPTGFTTNAAWAQYAEDYLVNTVHSGENADVIGNALGKYISGQPLTPDQVDLVQQAIAFANYPPLNGPTGYPPSYRTAETPVTPPPSGGGGSSTGKPGRPAHLHHGTITRTSIEVAWNRVAGATGYRVESVGASGWQSIGTTGATDTRHVHTHLQPHTQHKYRVFATNAAGSGPASAALTVTTAR